MPTRQSGRTRRVQPLDLDRFDVRAYHQYQVLRHRQQGPPILLQEICGASRVLQPRRTLPRRTTGDLAVADIVSSSHQKSPQLTPGHRGVALQRRFRAARQGRRSPVVELVGVLHSDGGGGEGLPLRRHTRADLARAGTPADICRAREAGQGSAAAVCLEGHLAPLVPAEPDGQGDLDVLLIMNLRLRRRLGRRMVRCARLVARRVAMPFIPASVPPESDALVDSSLAGVSWTSEQTTSCSRRKQRAGRRT
jgi:hypothetical protein